MEKRKIEIPFPGMTIEQRAIAAARASGRDESGAIALMADLEDKGYPPQVAGEKMEEFFGPFESYREALLESGALVPAYAITRTRIGHLAVMSIVPRLD